MNSSNRAPRRGRRRRGQSMAEYVILVGFLVMALAAIFGAFPRVISGYWKEISMILSLPLI